MTDRAGFRFFWSTRVRASEVDMQNIVFNAHYLSWFDAALTEYLRALDFDYRALIERDRLDFHVVKSTIEYHAPVPGDALVDVGIAAARIGRSSLTWRLGVFLAGEEQCRASGELVWVCARVGEHKSAPLPAELVQLLQGPDAST